jgi:hypothetical protein
MIAKLDYARAIAVLQNLRPLDRADLIAAGAGDIDALAQQMAARRNSFVVTNARGEHVFVFGLHPSAPRSLSLWGFGSAGLPPCMARVTQFLRACIASGFGSGLVERIESQVLRHNAACIAWHVRCLGMRFEGVRRGAGVGGFDYVLLGLVRADLAGRRARVPRAHIVAMTRALPSLLNSTVH